MNFNWELEAFTGKKTKTNKGYKTVRRDHNSSWTEGSINLLSLCFGCLVRNNPTLGFCCFVMDIFTLFLHFIDQWIIRIIKKINHKMNWYINTCLLLSFQKILLGGVVWCLVLSPHTTHRHAGQVKWPEGVNVSVNGCQSVSVSTCNTLVTWPRTTLPPAPTWAGIWWRSEQTLRLLSISSQYPERLLTSLGSLAVPVPREVMTVFCLQSLTWI